MIKIKTCSKCKQSKPLSCFQKSKRYKDGYRCWCNDCESKACKKWKIQNPKMNWAHHTRSDHKKKNIVINISNKDLLSFVANIETCNICGCKLNWGVDNKGSIFPNSPSLDRTNNEYEININNIQLICHKCNRTKGERTMKDFIRYCKNVYLKFGDILNEID